MSPPNLYSQATLQRVRSAAIQEGDLVEETLFGPPSDGSSRFRRSGPAMATRLEALSTAAASLGWAFVQAADAGTAGSVPGLDGSGLPRDLAPGAERPGSPADWRRFDAAWARIRRELSAQDLIGVGVALLEFAQACRITADRLAADQLPEDRVVAGPRANCR